VHEVVADADFEARAQSRRVGVTPSTNARSPAPKNCSAAPSRTSSVTAFASLAREPRSTLGDASTVPSRPDNARESERRIGTRPCHRAPGCRCQRRQDWRDECGRRRADRRYRIPPEPELSGEGACLVRRRR
jgi:hypothetical protein